MGFTKNWFFFFNTRISNYLDEVLLPCAIVKLCYVKPKIGIKEVNILEESRNNKTIKVIRSSSPFSRTYTIQLEAPGIPEYKDFYKEHDVIMKMVTYRENKLITSNNLIIHNKFSFFGYKIFEFSLKYCTEEGKNKITKEIIFFGPETKNSYFEEIVYSKNFFNCSLDMFNYAYLKEIKVGNKTYDAEVSLSKVNHVIKISHNHLVYKNNKNVVTHIDCIYNTPDGSIIYRKRYLKKRVLNRMTKKKRSIDKNLTKSSTNIRIFFFYLIIFILISASILSSFAFFWYVIRKKISLYIKMKRTRKLYPNIYSFWNIIINETLKEYCKNIYNAFCPIGDKSSGNTDTITLFGEEEGESITIVADDLFEHKLVKCYFDIECLVHAYYLNDASPVRRYILSEGPNNDTVQYFFKMLYMEDVGSVISITNISNGNADSQFCWPSEKVTFNGLSIELHDCYTSNSSSIAEYNYMLTLDNGVPKVVKIFQEKNWKEYDIPTSTKNIIKLYKSASLNGKNKPFLIHSSHGTTPGVFIFTYFACLIENMLNDWTLDNPTEILKNIKKECIGGNISDREYAFIIASLIDYFCEEKILVIRKNEYNNFYKDFDEYMIEWKINKDDNNKEVCHLLTFMLVINKYKLMDLCQQMLRTQLLTKNVLKDRCKLFFKILEEKKQKKIRYGKVFCLDHSAVLIRNKPITDIGSFIHANKIIYSIKDDKKRKLILCQAPLEETIDDMYDMLYRYNVGIIIVLLTPKEMNGSKPRWVPYFPIHQNQMITNTYIINRKGRKDSDKNNILEIDLNINPVNNQNESTSLRIYHYGKWYEKCKAPKIDDVLELVRRIMNDTNNNRYIVIHCNDGVGRAGTFALIIHMIDLINKKGMFSPMKSLNFLRKYRHGCVKMEEQIIFAILVIVEYFKDKLMACNSKIVSNFENMIFK
uniref:Protein-tyrosine-phosphatase n=1 Tax=Parastrongyloides trichosuri TaxID=131310 RepID=A0A0N4Z2G9_PARTI